MTQTREVPTSYPADHSALVSGLTTSIVGFALLLTGAVVPQVGAGIAFIGINVAYFALWHMVSPTTCCTAGSKEAS